MEPRSRETHHGSLGNQALGSFRTSGIVLPSEVQHRAVVPVFLLALARGPSDGCSGAGGHRRHSVSRLDSEVATEEKIADPHAAGVAAVMTVGFFTYACFCPGMKCLRYVSPANGTYCLLSGFGLWYFLFVGSRACHAWIAERSSSWPPSRW